jgi:septal ring factor EnvC (AmiA/AmiB activator)
MEELQKQVQRARWRMTMQQFFQVVAWWLFTTFAIAAVAIAIPKIWYLNIDSDIWVVSWLGGALAVGLLGSLLTTWFVRRGVLDAAMEIDRRYGLKERVASSLSLTDKDLESEAGRALQADAVNRVVQLEISEQFSVGADRKVLLPLIPVLLSLGLFMFVSDAGMDPASAASAQAAAEKEQIKRAAEELKKKIVSQQKKAAANGLKDAEKIFTKLTNGIDKLTSKSDVDRKKAMIELNDLAKELAERKEKLGGSEEMKKQFSQLKNLSKGPADRMAKAMKQGDFQAALDELKNLKDKLEKGELSDEDKKKLAEQMNEMKKKLEDLVAAQEQAKQELQRQIDEKMAQGDVAAAQQLQQQLDQMNQQQQQMQAMANKMANAAKALEDGDPADAAAQMAQLAEDVQQMAQEMQELESMQEALDQIAQAKDGMGCKECQGGGCQACQGQGMGQGQGQGEKPGRGLGEGQGFGERPEEENDTQTVDSQVRDTPRQGEAVRVGDAGGPNQAGNSLAEINQSVTEGLSSQADPLADQRLPRGQKDNAKQYFNSLREGQ